MNRGWQDQLYQGFARGIARHATTPIDKKVADSILPIFMGTSLILI